MLKVLQKHTQAKIKTVQADFNVENNDFIVTETPQNSLTKFLAEGSSSPLPNLNENTETPPSASSEHEESKATSGGPVEEEKANKN